MGRIISSYIFPHPPIIVPEVGKGNERFASNTIDAVKRAAGDIKNDKPTTIIITTPHGPVFQDYIHISVSETLKGNFEGFGSREVEMSFQNNLEMVNRIINYSENEGILCGGIDEKLAKKYSISRELDHGVLVPLYFINEVYKNFKIVHISIAGLPYEDLYRFGMCISRVVSEMDERVFFLASGDLSHRLSKDAPYGFNKRGIEFDELVVNSLKKLDIKSLMNIDEGFCESAGQCGLRSFLIMFGALDGFDVKPEVYSYEGPFGVGYSVARFDIQGQNPERQLLKKIEEENLKLIKDIRIEEDYYINLARASLEYYVKNGKKMYIPEGLPEEMLENRSGTFVSIKKHGQLRGCIGTTGPTTKNVAEEIIQNAISAGVRDPRFDPVEEAELDKLVYSVDVLKEAEPINSIDELDVIKYGVIVRTATRSGLLLPNLEGVETPEEQVAIALQKAGIRPTERYSMERFEVIRHR